MNLIKTTRSVNIKKTGQNNVVLEGGITIQKGDTISSLELKVMLSKWVLFLSDFWTAFLIKSCLRPHTKIQGKKGKRGVSERESLKVKIQVWK